MGLKGDRHRGGAHITKGQEPPPRMLKGYPQKYPGTVRPILGRRGVRLRQMAKFPPPAVWPFARGGQPIYSENWV